MRKARKREKIKKDSKKFRLRDEPSSIDSVNLESDEEEEVEEVPLKRKKKASLFGSASKKKRTPKKKKKTDPSKEWTISKRKRKKQFASVGKHSWFSGLDV